MNKNHEFQSAVKLALVIVVMGLGVFCALAEMPDDEAKPDQYTPMVMQDSPTPMVTTPTPQATPKAPRKRKTPRPQRIADIETPLPTGPTPAGPTELKENPVGQPLMLVPTPTVPSGAQ
jgi:hypothetical protein